MYIYDACDSTRRCVTASLPPDANGVSKVTQPPLTRRLSKVSGLRATVTEHAQLLAEPRSEDLASRARVSDTRFVFPLACVEAARSHEEQTRRDAKRSAMRSHVLSPSKPRTRDRSIVLLDCRVRKIDLRGLQSIGAPLCPSPGGY